MNPAQIAKIMSLVEQYGEACDNFTLGAHSAQAISARAAVEAALRDAPQAEPSMRDRLQKQCSDWGTYWRAPDSHGVELTMPQAIELLQDALGVEVEIKHNGCTTCDGNGMIGGPSYYSPDEGGIPCPACAAPSAPTAVERKPLFGEMIAQHPGLREEMLAEQGAPTVKDCLTTAAAVEPRDEREAWTNEGVDDLCWSAFESAMASGVSVDSFRWLANSLRAKQLPARASKGTPK